MHGKNRATDSFDLLGRVPRDSGPFAQDLAGTWGDSGAEWLGLARARRAKMGLTCAPGVVHDVRLRIRGIFEPTTIAGGETPHPDHPYYKVGGAVRAREWSAWHIEVSNPKQTYWLNHYPRVSHTIYLEDFEATIPVAGGSAVVVRVVDGNNRQIDNSEPGRPDRMQIIKGVVDTPLGGQMLRLDVIRVTAR